MGDVHSSAFEAGSDVVLVYEPEGLRQIAEWSKTNGVNHVTFYVDNTPAVFAEHYMKREGSGVDEAMLHKSPDDEEKALKRCASCLAEMLSTQQSWAKLIKSEEISAYVPLFNQHNQESVVRVIMDEVIGLTNVTRIRRVAA